MEVSKQPAPLIISSSPHIHCGSTISMAMRDVLLALLPATLASLWLFGPDALVVILACCLSAVIFEAICQKIMQRPLTIGDGSALLTGLLLAFCLPPAISPLSAVFGSFCAIVIGKQVFGGLGNNIFNPAHIGRAILLASMPQQMTTWTKPLAWDSRLAWGNPAKVDAVTTATPLALMRQMESNWQSGDISAIDTTLDQLPSLWQLFIGSTAGSLGETSALALLIGGLFLVWRGHIDWRIPFYYLTTVFVLTGTYAWFFHYEFWFPVYHLLSGGLIIGAFFMATDWVTSPLTKRGRIIFAIGLGLLTALIRLRGGYVEGVCYSILIMNMLTPLIDRYVTNAPFGGDK